VAGVVHRVKTLGLKKEMPDLTAHHRQQPAHQGGQRGVRKQQYVSGEETQRADQMQRLVDTAVMVVAMVVPALGSEGFEKIVHGWPVRSIGWDMPFVLGQ